MKRGHRTWWLMYGLGALVTIAVMVWVSALVLRLERREVEARVEASHQEAMRLGLWRMESWLAPRVMIEATRPYYEYQPFYTADRAYTRVLHEIQQGEIYTPSPLLTFESEFFLLHFQENPDGTIVSPQVPQASFRDLAETNYRSAEQIQRSDALLRRVAGWLQTDETVAFQVACGVANVAELANFEQVELQQGVGDDLVAQSKAQIAKNQVEWGRRAQISNEYNVQQIDAGDSLPPPQQLDVDPRQQRAQKGTGQTLPFGAPGFRRDDVQLGPLVPVWVQADGVDSDRALLLIREGQTGEESFRQGILLNWQRVREQLMIELIDLFPEVELAPVPVESVRPSGPGNVLATIPVALQASRPPVVVTGLLTPARSTLALSWLAIVIAILAAGFSLRSSCAFGEKRSRFASAVTHELRTPLTTFQMYSEMLADGMVCDETQRQTYLDTLKDESGRLSNLVENVLSYARLEEGRTPLRARPVPVVELLRRVEPMLMKRAEQAGMALIVQNEAEAGATARVDVDAVGQILFNLIDNACKYGGSDEATIELAVAERAHAVEIAVQDHGPGVAMELERAIFRPFDRGQREPGDALPGVGLGLALARGLARDLGGDLTVRSSVDGACFVLSLPRATAT